LDFAELVGEVLATRRGRAEATGVTLQGSLPAGEKLRGERDRLALAIGNLIDNALDQAPAGSRIDVSLERTTERIELEVRDAGPGIPDYALPRLFERFYGLPRADGSKGSGLGLAIVQEVAMLHGGSVTLSNLPAGGALATLSLPTTS
jgi:two-component system sensor histidine kinase CreC